MSTALTSANNAPSAAIVNQPQVAQSANEKSNLVITHNNGDSTRCSCCSMTTFHCTILSGGIGAIFFPPYPLRCGRPHPQGALPVGPSQVVCAEELSVLVQVVL